VFSLKSKAWQLGLTGMLLVVTYIGSLTAPIATLERDLFLFILNFRSTSQVVTNAASIPLPPQWAVILIYALILAVYVRKYTRAKTTGVSFLSIIIIFFALLMLEILLAILNQVYLPVLLPGLVMIFVSSVYWVKRVYLKVAASQLLQRESVSLDDIRNLIEQGELKKALYLLKLCPYSDDLLEVGYELGMLLESNKHWASALNLYHWLSQYDPGLSDFVTRIEELRQKRATVDVTPVADASFPVIGHYQPLKKIAKGSTAVVYEARDLRTHNRVALKVMVTPSAEGIEQDRIKHWLREAEIVSQFEHDNIVKIHDAAMENNSAYIAMDFISGYSMSLRLRKREYITVGEFIRISKAVLNALAVAHSHGIVHGDIKPANIMYDNQHDTYIVTDFGAAYTVSKGRQGKDETIIGTPSYMSPEQLQGKKLDGRSDLFSLAVTLYHLLTGHQPFSAPSLHHLKQSIINDEPDLNHLTLTTGLIEVIHKALQKKTYMRFADAQQMLTAIEHCEIQLMGKMKRKI
jgi:tRNA A-37 threonylcarbamoyl transferase component Bud32